MSRRRTEATEASGRQLRARSSTTWPYPRGSGAGSPCPSVLRDRHTLLLLAPAPAAFEAGVTLVAAYRGFLGDRIRAAARRAAADLPECLRRRSEIQDRRVVPDAEILSGDRLMPPEALASGPVATGLVGFASRAYRLYWRGVRRWM